ncbi:MAG: hypothetical protein JXK51_10140 [Halothiobacillaceae bacterium]|jgi:opacity protein-like surface antigen|nr:hypothetical protein [Halothiobacillaceae bacterium]HQS02202.1 hypothetical protein [Halothiobacillus sp.]HQS29012.1 hypothetical protein [Halothiobacillus sp.]HUN00599.1 hypothetical protein [Halothiobacillus sp.]
MKKLILLTAVAGLMTGAVQAADVAKPEVIINPNIRFLGHTVPMNGSDIFGTITITPVSADKTKLSAEFKGKNVAGPMTFVLNHGRCDDAAAKVKFPLTNVVHGKSETVINSATPLLFEGDVLSYNLSEGGKVVSCGEVQ